MQKLLFIKNGQRGHPGAMAGLLDEWNIDFEVADLYAGDDFGHPKNYAAIIVLGGRDSANDETHKIETEIANVQEILERKIPYLGICLGMHILVKAAGGEVYTAEQPELGFYEPQSHARYKLDLTPDGLKSQFLDGLPKTLNVYEHHYDSVILAGSTKLLAGGHPCYNQIVQVGTNAFGVQPHIELTPEMLKFWAQEAPELKPIGAENLLAAMAEISDEYNFTARKIMENFVKIAGLK